MFSKLVKYLEDKEREYRLSFGDDLSTPEKRREAQRHFNWVDHGLLRTWWTNFAEVGKDVYRSNHPNPKRLAAYKKRGIKSVLNLRGTSVYSHYLFETEACKSLGLNLTDVHLSATALPSLRAIEELESHFRTLQKPFVMHCKSGADRAGFASALYLLLVENRPIEEAQAQLSFRFLHIKASEKGILDYCLEKYRKTNKASPIAFRDWLENMYDPDEILNEFLANRRKVA